MNMWTSRTSIHVERAQATREELYRPRLMDRTSRQQLAERWGEKMAAAAAARGKTRGGLGEHRHPAGAEPVAQPHVAATDRRMQGPDPSHRTARVRASHEQTTRELVVPADDRQRQRTGAVRTRCVHVRTGRNQRRRGSTPGS